MDRFKYGSSSLVKNISLLPVVTLLKTETAGNLENL